MSRSDDNPGISVVIPTYNRADYLQGCLESLTRQSCGPQSFEVIVVDDGSTDPTAEVCRCFEGRLSMRYQRQGNAGIAAAKNVGLFLARAPIVFFFDDDDVADERLLEEHLKSHAAHPEESVAVLNYTTWHPSLSVSALMHFVTEVGQHLFAYRNLKHGQQLDFTYFWGGRSSCKRDFLLRHGVFNPLFRFGAEDIELGYRLSKFGLRVVYNSRALSYMARPITFREFCARCERQGISQYAFALLHRDPKVRTWCMIEGARIKWEKAERHLSVALAQAELLEQALHSEREQKDVPRALKPKTDSPLPRDSQRVMSSEERQKLTDRLHSIYWHCFDVFKFKGLCKAEILHHQKCQTMLIKSLKGREPLRHPTYTPAIPEREGILFFDLFLPMFDRASGCLRTLHILKGLLALGFHVTFIARYPEHASQYVPILQRLGIEVYAGDPDAPGVRTDADTLWKIDLPKILKRRPYRAAIISYWDNAEHYLPRLRLADPDLPIIVDSVDIVFLRKIREAELSGDVQQKDLALRNRAREVAVYRKADELWVVTEADAAVVREFTGDLPVRVVPNIHEPVKQEKSFEDTADLLFVGNFWHQPNVDAVLYFLRSVFPLVRQEIPDVRLRIVGDHAPEELRKLGSESVVFEGYVPDLSPLLSSSRISIAPLRYGAGMKGKIGEALSWGLPVVTTSIGAEGMDLTDGENVLIGDNPGEFARQIVRLYRDPELWRKISESGKRHVEGRWSPEHLSRILQEAFRRPSETDVDRSKKAKAPRTSIVVLTLNGLPYTRQCLESIEEYTPEPHEIIVIDNGSTDGTLPWLRKFARLHRNCRIIENRRNLGFAKGCNQGLEAARGEFVVLLNNDTVVTEGWLAGLLEGLRGAPDIGIVGPMTNCISGIQQVPQIGYDDLQGMQAFARSFRERNRKRRIESHRLVGFCMLFRKRLIREIGGLDESFGTGNFEDDDICLRALLAGYRNLIIGDVFIHHFGSRTFLNQRIDLATSLRRNRKIFNDKWTRPEIARQYGERLIAINAFHQAESLRRKGHYDEAIAVLTEVLRQNPTDKDRLCRLARLLLSAGRFQDSESILQPFEGLRCCRVQELLGRCAAAGGKESQAMEYAERALAIDPDDVRSLCLKGILLHRGGALTQAANCFEEAICRDSSDGEAYCGLGAVRWDMGERDQALALFERGFLLSPTEPEIAAAYHAAVLETGDLKRAASFIREACALYPDDRKLCFMHIAILIQLEEFSSAMAEIERAIGAFRIDDGMLRAALNVREKLGPKTFSSGSSSKPSLSVCMIVRNEEANIIRCLASIKALADEVVVVDTGSQDRTREMAQVMGGRVDDFPWNDDFSAARNHALSLARGDWILVLDADETLAAEDHERIRRLIRNRRGKPRAFRLVTRNYTDECGARGWVANDGSYPELEKGSGWFPSVKVRLFPRDPRIRFVHPVHEVVEPTLRKAGIPILDCDVPIHHYGRLDKARLKKKGAHYLALGMKKLDQLGEDETALRELARQAAGLEDYERALALWERLLAAQPEDAGAWMNASFAALRCKRFDQAVAHAQRALELDPGMREAALNLAAGHWARGELKAAERVLERLLAKEKDYPPALCRMAALRFVQGREAEALFLVRRLRALGFDPDGPLNELACDLSRGGRQDLARLLLERGVEAVAVSGTAPSGSLSPEERTQARSAVGRGGRGESVSSAPL